MDFERTTLEPRSLGKTYFYNYALLNQVMRYDENWKRPDGLQHDIINANINLSLVEAQVVSLPGVAVRRFRQTPIVAHELY